MDAPGAPCQIRPTASWALIFWLTSAHQLAPARSDDVNVLAERHPGCFFDKQKFSPTLDSGHQEPSLINCQRACRWNSTCSAFNYWPTTSDCQFVDRHSATLSASTDTVAGLAFCRGDLQRSECLTDKPGNGFPGYTASGSDAAWPAGRQPGRGSCWPVDFFGSFARCDSYVILEDTTKGWAGRCLGFFPKPEVVGEAACSKLCQQDPKCPAWKVGANGSCLHGLGEDCFDRANPRAAAGQRLMHGKVRVLMDLTGWHILGLRRVFVDHAGYFADSDDAVSSCRRICYSAIECQYWQYTPKYGCWVDDPWADYRLPDPLTLDWAKRSTPFALDVIAGEMIQHYCPSADAEDGRPSVMECAGKGSLYQKSATGWSDDSLETSAQLCQDACARNDKCAYFTFWSKGLCRLVDSSATLVAAKDDSVLYGPPDCSMTTTTTLTTTTQLIQIVLPDAKTSDEAPVVSQIKDIYSPLHGSGTSMVYYIGLNYTLEDVNVEDLDHKTADLLSSRLAIALATVMGVPLSTVSESCVGGRPGTVLLTGIDGTNSEITGCFPNRPPESKDISEAMAALITQTTLNTLLAVMSHIVFVDNPAVRGPWAVRAGIFSRIEKEAPAEVTWFSIWYLPLAALAVVCICIPLLTVYCRQFGGDSEWEGSDSEKVGFASWHRRESRKPGQSQNNQQQSPQHWRGRTAAASPFSSKQGSPTPKSRRSGEFTV
mmetsp:Transcript_35327/g.75282  ORF Transcript_35327/g.75282 Transcript_35327/m.75282 type:complete len:714 (+) Transcript_35327:42-2183(+)